MTTENLDPAAAAVPGPVLFAPCTDYPEQIRPVGGNYLVWADGDGHLSICMAPGKRLAQISLDLAKAGVRADFDAVALRKFAAQLLGAADYLDGGRS